MPGLVLKSCVSEIHAQRIPVNQGVVNIWVFRTCNQTAWTPDETNKHYVNDILDFVFQLQKWCDSCLDYTLQA